MSEWSQQTQQLVALTSYLGVLTGTLQERGVLSAGDIEQVFHLANSLLPEEAREHGSYILEVVQRGYPSAGGNGSADQPGSNVAAFPPG
ncbi:hypothetical protein [Roseomonas sp. BN140053]|uniref:hypothetical protein n=1 Tax=Roseomonas sp. BN140053 TaxID=3391898 RepID=UPI0039EA6A3F